MGSFRLSTEARRGEKEDEVKGEKGSENESAKM
jgi:hypothetical protein